MKKERIGEEEEQSRHPGHYPERLLKQVSLLSEKAKLRHYALKPHGSLTVLQVDPGKPVLQGLRKLRGIGVRHVEENVDVIRKI